MKMHKILFAGFGGQGVLFAGKVIAYAALLDGWEVTWLPSYGPEMRGGTANCSVCFSRDPIGAPMVTEPYYLIALNEPSLQKFLPHVEEGGKLFFDINLVSEEVKRDAIDIYPVQATACTVQAGLEGMSNMVLLGKFIHETKLFEQPTVEKALEKCIPPSKKALYEKNLQALALGQV